MRRLLFLACGVILTWALYLGGAFAPPRTHHGWVVAKEYEGVHMCCSAGKRAQEAIVIPATAHHHHHRVAPRFTVYAANRTGVYDLGYDSIGYTRIRCGQRISFRR